MKYLKKFNENISNFEIRNYLNDVLLELEDIGLIVKKSFLYKRKSVISNNYNEYESDLDEFDIRGDNNVGIRIKVSNSINRVDLSNIYYPISHFVDYISYIFPKVLIIIDHNNKKTIDYFKENNSNNWNVINIYLNK